jgi:hypothetical protein
VPLKVGAWDGHLVQGAEATMPEEMVGRNVTVRYVHRATGAVVVVYLACGRAATMEGHTPMQCYPANGYKVVAPESRLSPLPGGDGERPEFWAATFGQGHSAGPIHLRVFWSWQDAGRWRAPDNPGRAFRAASYLYKCYAIRVLTTPEEPLEGDPGVEFLRELLPQLDRALAAA